MQILAEYFSAWPPNPNHRDCITQDWSICIVVGQSVHKQSHRIRIYIHIETTAACMLRHETLLWRCLNNFCLQTCCFDMACISKAAAKFRVHILSMLRIRGCTCNNPMFPLHCFVILCLKFTIALVLVVNRKSPKMLLWDIWCELPVSGNAILATTFQFNV